MDLGWFGLAVILASTVLPSKGLQFQSPYRVWLLEPESGTWALRAQGGLAPNQGNIDLNRP